MNRYKYSRAEGVATFGTLQTTSTSASLTAATEDVIDIPAGAKYALLTVQPGAMLLYKTDSIAAATSIAAPAASPGAPNGEQSSTTGTRETWGFNSDSKLHLYASADAWVNVEWFTGG